MTSIRLLDRALEFVGRGSNPGTHRSLPEIRIAIDLIDDEVVALLEQRTKLVLDALEYKDDVRVDVAPERQAEVIARVTAKARAGTPDIPGFPDFVSDVYSALIARSIALQLEVQGDA